jgi:Flp pilus assembly protein TadB
MKKKLSENLRKAGIEDNADEYLVKALKKATALAVVGVCLTLLYGMPALTSLTAGLAFFLFALLLMIYAPATKAKKRGLLIEKDLPFALMNMGVELNIGMPFEKVLEKQAGKTEWGMEIGKAVRDVKYRGLSVQQALFKIPARVESASLKRAVYRMIDLYEQGPEEQGEIMTRMAKELLARQKTEAKEFSGKMVMMSLLFIVVSAIVPALLLSFISVGSTFMDIDISPVFVLLFFTVVFPVVDLVLLLTIKEKTPVFMRSV